MSNIINLLLSCQVDLRSYNWRERYIRAVDFQNLNLQNLDFSGSTFDRCRFSQSLGSIINLAFSPDGKYLAASDTKYQIKIWDIAADREIALLLGHQSWVWQIQFSPDSKYLISGSTDRTMRVWEVASGQCLQVITAHQDWVWKVAFSLNSKLAISIGADRYIKVWWWRTGRNLLSFKVPDGHVRDGAFHGKRGLLAICSDKGIKVWQVWLGRRILKISTANAFNLRLISFSPDGKTLVGTSFTCEIHCWEVDSGRHLFKLLGHPTQVFEVNYNEEGNLISICLEQVRVWNLDTGNCLKTISLAQDCGKGVAYRSQLIATGSDNGTVKIWNLETGKCLQTATGNAPRIMSAAVHPHERTIASTQDDGTLKVWNLDSPLINGELPPVRVYRGHQGMSGEVAFSDDGTRIATTGSDRVINIWDVQTGNMLQSLRGHTDYVVQILFLDDRTLLSQSYDASTRQWDLHTGTSEILTHLQSQWCMGFTRSADGQLILFGSDTPLLTILDRQTGSLRSFPAVGSRLRRLAYTNDNRYIIGICDDRYLNLWDLANNYAHCSWHLGDREIGAIRSHPHHPHLLLTAAEDGYISIWNLQTQTCNDRVLAHQGEIRSLGVIANPDCLVSAGIDGSIKVWEFSAETIVETYSIDFPRPYQGLKLTDVKGLNRSQLATLSQLGAIV